MKNGRFACIKNYDDLFIINKTYEYSRATMFAVATLIKSERNTWELVTNESFIKNHFISVSEQRKYKLQIIWK